MSTVKVILPVVVARRLAGLAKREARARRARAARSGYVPPPGKFDANIARAMQLEAAVQQIEEGLREASVEPG